MAGQIHDDTIYAELVGCMPEGSTLTCLLDCCHSGSVLDLPYMFKAGDGLQQKMGKNPKANFNKLKTMAIAYLVSKVFGKGKGAQLALMALTGSLDGGGDGSGGAGGLMSLSLLKQLFGMVSCAAE
jgi:hypothetical protein